METFKRLIQHKGVWLGLGIWVLAGLVVIGDHFELNKSEWASWVQGIGSLAAILGAYAFTAKQHSDSVERDKRNRNAERSQRAETIQFVMGDAQAHSDRLRNFFEAGMAHEVVHYNLKTLKDCAEVIASIPALDYPDASLAVHCRTFNRYFQAVASQYQRRSEVITVDFDEFEQMQASALDTDIDNMAIAAKSAFEQATYLISVLATRI
ncbi:hypothetical protein [Burkholderia sp. LMU1-1-1.1]|uniref:hypothetical protein n=1 Tax=Burkholderia sp. LMU1-1-1.1 TaxID=3135266 RepID=UPI00343F04B8